MKPSGATISRVLAVWIAVGIFALATHGPAAAQDPVDYVEIASNGAFSIFGKSATPEEFVRTINVKESNWLRIRIHPSVSWRVFTEVFEKLLPAYGRNRVTAEFITKLESGNQKRETIRLYDFTAPIPKKSLSDPTSEVFRVHVSGKKEKPVFHRDGKDITQADLIDAIERHGTAEQLVGKYPGWHLVANPETLFGEVVPILEAIAEHKAFESPVRFSARENSDPFSKRPISRIPKKRIPYIPPGKPSAAP